jgi:hypothetical protein
MSWTADCAWAELSGRSAYLVWYTLLRSNQGGLTTTLFAAYALTEVSTARIYFDKFRSWTRLTAITSGRIRNISSLPHPIRPIPIPSL